MFFCGLVLSCLLRSLAVCVSCIDGSLYGGAMYSGYGFVQDESFTTASYGSAKVSRVWREGSYAIGVTRKGRRLMRALVGLINLGKLVGRLESWRYSLRRIGFGNLKFTKSRARGDEEYGETSGCISGFGALYTNCRALRFVVWKRGDLGGFDMKDMEPCISMSYGW
ncbi:hypothetical protein Bca52824_014436 [Brassica carinata]|uniref:Uncharacterized protein n=1 Tax=Brassica carinata TaxID=52824 RepID=A0A8X7W2U0_BRACI|nr:hypothetical protein Bca52824_014436 [Brassica carinata]